MSTVAKMLLLIALPSLLLIGGTALWYSWPDASSGPMKTGSYAILKDGSETSVYLSRTPPGKISGDLRDSVFVAAGTRVAIVDDGLEGEISLEKSGWRSVLVNVADGPHAGTAAYVTRNKLIPQ